MDAADDRSTALVAAGAAAAAEPRTDASSAGAAPRPTSSAMRDPGRRDAVARADGQEPSLLRRWGPGAVEVGLGLLVVAAVLWPVTAHPGERLAGSLDAPYHAWLGWRIAELWRHGHLLTVVIPDAVAPMGLDLRLIDGLLPGWVTAVFGLVTGGNLVLSYNLALATGIGLDLWAGRRLAQVLSDRRWVWFACGVAFATAPALAGSAQAHIAFVYAFTLPLLVREAVLLARGEVGVRVVRLIALLVLAYLCSAYHLVFGAITFVLVVALWPRTAARSRSALARLGLVLVGTLVVLSPFIVSRISYERDERAAGSPDVTRVTESVAFSADLFGAITPPDSLWIDAPVPRADLGVQLYAPLRPAFVGYALLGGLVLLAWAKRPPRRPLLITAAVLWVLSLGPVLHVAGSTVGGSASEPSWFMPYRWLQALPGLGALRAPTRASYALAAVLTAALAVGLDALLDRVRPGAGEAQPHPPETRPPETRSSETRSPETRPPETRPPETRSSDGVPGSLVAVATGVLLVLSITAPMPTSDLGLDAGARRALEQIGRTAPDDLGHDGVLIVPWGCRLDDPRILALQSIHRQPNIGCNPPPTATRWFSGIDAWARSRELAALRCDPTHVDRRPVPFDEHVRLDDAGIQRLRDDLGVRYVVVDEAAMCAPVAGALDVLQGYEHVDTGNWTIIDLQTRAP